MRKLALSLAIVTSLGVFSNAQSLQYIDQTVKNQSGNSTTGSARYIGMGGAMGALGGDVSSIEQNPAGSGVAITSDVSVTAGINTYSNKTTFGSTLETKDSEFNISHFGATFVFNTKDSDWNRFTLGINYTREFLNNELEIGENNNIQTLIPTNENPDVIDTYTFKNYSDRTVGYKNKFALNLGTSYNDKVYLGASVNFHSTDFINYVNYTEDVNNGEFTDYYNLNGTPYSSNSTGVSVGLGIIGKVNNNLRLGAAYHSPTWYSDVQEVYYTAEYDSDSAEFPSIYEDEAFFDLTTAGRFVGSAGLVISKNLALNADYTYHINGSTQLKPSNYFTNENEFFEDYLINNSELRLGGELRLDKFKLRAGYNYIQSPFKNISLLSNIGNGQSTSITEFSKAIKGDTNRVSIGAGYDFGGFYLDAAYQYSTQNYNYIFGNADYYNNDIIIPLPQENYVAEVNNKQGLFLLTAGWQF